MRLRILCQLLLAAALAGCAPQMVVAPAPAPVPEGPVQGPAAPPPLGLDDPLPTDPALLTGRLPNGLSYYVRSNTEPADRTELWLVVDAGSVLEDDDQRGLAHLVEHMAFNGTRRFGEGELVDFLERAGMQFGPDVNATTGFDETVYTLRLPAQPEFLERGLEVLEDWADGIRFDPEALERERRVVIEEWRLDRGAGARLRDRQIPLLFRGSRYAERLPIGDPEVLESAPLAALRRFYRDWYRPDLMAVIAVGDFAPQPMAEAIRRRFSRLEPPADPRPRPLVPVPDHADTLVGIFTDPEVTVTNVGVFYKLDRRPERTVADYRRLLAEELYHAMLNTRLAEVGRRPDPPFLWAGSSSGGFVRSRDVYSQSAGVRPGELVRGLEALLLEVERVDRHGFTAGELERQKSEMLRRYERAWAERDQWESASLAAEYSRNFLDGEPVPGIEVELRLVRRLLPGIGVDELNRLAAQWISEENRAVLVSAPQSEAEALPDADSLLAVFHDVEQRPIEPYVDDAPTGPLLAEPPAGGAVVERRRLTQLEVVEWRLSNGVRVVLKPTDFRNDQVLVDGFSPGGHSLAGDEEFASVSFAELVVGESGVGELSAVELSKALAGKLAGARPRISSYEEGISASASPRDLETMLELIYLYFTRPRFDADAFASWRTRTSDLLRNRLARPETAFFDRLTEVLTQDHPRARPPTPDTLAAIDPAAALDFYRQRFADAADFTFVVVGSFDPDDIEPLIATYLGGLPAAGRQESWVDRGIREPPGAVRFEVRQGLEPRATVYLVLHGESPWSRQGAHALGILTDALAIRLRDVLREELGATYDVGVGGSHTQIPRPGHRLRISFSCDPARAEALIERLLAELETVRRDGFDPETLAKVREQQHRQRELDLRENSWWLGSLGFHYRHGLDPELILDHDQLDAAVGDAELAEAATRYLDPERYVLGVLKPEESAGSERR